MFTERYVNDKLTDLLIPRDHYRPFPTFADREAWEGLPHDLREERIRFGETFIDYAWPSLPATRFLDFSRTGNRRKFERLFLKRRQVLSALVVAECVQGEGRFIDDIVNGIWCICEETSWALPAHNYLGRRGGGPLPDVTDPIIDLAAGETAGLLVWTTYLLEAELDRVSDLISARIRYEIKRRILDPFLEREDFWWMGFNPGRRKVNNWNPWCNANCLLSFLVLENDASRRSRAVAKAMRSLDRFIETYDDDGGCDEGTSYWDKAGGMLFDCLELLYDASNGEIDLYDEPLIQEIGRYIYRSHISDDYFINFADGSAKVNLSANLVYRYGRRIGDAQLMAIGLHAHQAQSGKKDAKAQKVQFPAALTRQLPALFDYAEMESKASETPYEPVRDVWLNGIQVMATREQEGSTGGLYLAAKGGHNDESHNHNDIGHFIVYADGQPMFIDVGVETYTAQTFSPRRYDIWTMQSAYHNLPTVNGIQQQAGRDFKATRVAYDATEDYTELRMDLATAYPELAGIERWVRRLRLERADSSLITVTDAFKLDKKSDDIVLNLMTPHAHTITGDTIVLHNGLRMNMQSDGARLLLTSEKIAIEDERLGIVWGDHLFRIQAKVTHPIREGAWTMTITPPSDKEG